MPAGSAPTGSALAVRDEAPAATTPSLRGGRAKGRALRLTAAAVVGGLLVVAAGALLRPVGEPAARSAPSLAGAVPGTPAAIGRAQARVQEVPQDWSAWAGLGLAYVEQARVSADPSFYDKAQGALDRSLAVRPKDNAAASTGLGALAAARHDFSVAHRHAREAVTAAPYSAPAYGVLADASIELGRYEEGFEAVQKMVDLRPGTASYGRASYAFELRGDLPAAKDALEQALETAASSSDAAFALHYLGELAWNAGDLTTAETRFEDGLRRAPDDVLLRAGRAKTRAAKGDVPGAIADYRASTGRLPLPSVVAEYGDLMAAEKQAPAAAEQYALVRAQQRLFAAAGVDTDLEMALFDADHGAVAAALTAARAAYGERKSIFAADALAWALHRNGRHAEALPYAKEAVRLGTRSALLRYHLGSIEAALGQRDAARADLTSALAINPHFSVQQAPIARALLAKVGGKA